MNDELWLKKIKERLDDCSEPLPPGGWERLQRELDKAVPPAVPRRNRLVTMRRWSVAAAASVLVAVSAVSLWLLRSPAGQEAFRVEVPVVTHPDEVPRPVSVDEQLALASEAPSQTVTDRMIVPSVKKVLSDRKTSEVTPAEESGEAVTELPAAGKTAAEERTASGEEKEQKTVRRSGSKKTSLDEPRVITPGRRKSGGGWSFGLSVGNHSGLSGSNEGNFQNDPTPGGNWMQGSNINLSATANGVMTIPSEQELMFKDGMPYVQKRSKEPDDVKHHQPVSVGFSIRKNLGHGFSVESGLMYTYLHSDLYFNERNDSKEQKLHYVGIPLRVNWNFVDTRRFFVYLSGVGAVEKCVYGKLGSETQTVKPVQLSVLGSLGAQYNLSGRWGLYVEPGVSYYFDDGSEVQTIRKDRPCSFTLQAGLRLTY